MNSVHFCRCLRHEAKVFLWCWWGTELARAESLVYRF